MRADRQRLVKQFQGEGGAQWKSVRKLKQRVRILNEARAKAIEIEGQAEARANEYYKVFQENRS